MYVPTGIDFLVFEKLDGCSVVMGDNRPCYMEGIGTIFIKMFDEMVRELKDTRYIPQLTRNFISVGTLEARLKCLLDMVFSK